MTYFDEKLVDCNLKGGLILFLILTSRKYNPLVCNEIGTSLIEYDDSTQCHKISDI